MHKFSTFFLAAISLCAAVSAKAQSASAVDTTVFYNLQEIVVSSTKAPSNAPFAISDISQRQLEEFSLQVQELPYLFANTPGVLAYGDNGLGSGTTYLRIRGAGDSRINVTLDGVPLNSPEDQCVFWANMNSYAAFLGGVQIQRGVGSSSNGDGAFGGTVALTTKAPTTDPTLDLSISYGSYNSMKANAGFSSGLLGKHFLIDGGLSYSRTDGYIHGTQGDGGNWIVGLHGLISDRLIIRYRNIGNVERTGQAWSGVTAGNDDLSLMDGTFGATTGIHTYADMCRVGLGRYNSLYEQLVTDEDGNFVKDEKGHYQTTRLPYKDGFWARTTDNFIQDHNILSLGWNINSEWQFNAALHYTYGYGYYDQLRPQYKVKKFGIDDIWSPEGKTCTDFVRQKGMQQHTFGAIANANYNHENWHLQMGLSAQELMANHFGYLTYIANPEIEAKLPEVTTWYDPTNSHLQYYNSDARKTDVSLFAKLAYDFTHYLSGFADLQYRYVHYETSGNNDKFVKKDGHLTNQDLIINEDYHFANPKLGLDFHLNGHKAFASFAMSNREPERNNFTDNGAYPAPKPEMLFDYELGYNYQGKKFEVATTLYFMDYRNQFVQTGAQSDIGENLTTNIKKSYRMGIELAAAYTPIHWFTIDGTLALSRNRILDFDEVVEDWDDWEGNTDLDIHGQPFDGDGYTTIHHSNTALAFSPSAIAGVNATFRFLKGAKIQWHTSCVSRQYLDNSENKDRSLPTYTFTDITLGYNWRPQVKWMRGLDFNLKFGNIFNSHYAQSGWVYSALNASAGHDNDNRYYQIGFVPAAGFTVMGSIAWHLF